MNRIYACLSVLVMFLCITLGCSSDDNTDITPFTGGYSTDQSEKQPTEIKAVTPPGTTYLIGTGIHDITGPPAGVMFGGYVDFQQKGKGLFMRQFSRAFIIKEDDGDAESKRRIVLVNADLPLPSAGVYAHVISKLKEEYGDLYTEKNVNIAVTHTHSGPGGYFKTYMLNILAGISFHEDNFNTIVNGIYASIVQAHNNLSPGKIVLNSDEFSADINNTGEFFTEYRINRNRSPEAYALNRDIDAYLLPDGRYDETNRRISQLKFMSADNSVIGIYNWTPVHPNLAGPKQFLINGDVMGYAANLFEKANGTDYISNTPFIAAFAMNDCADTSGNLPEDSLFFDDIENRDLDNPDDDYQADGTHDYDRIAMRAKTVYVYADKMLKDDGRELNGSIEYRQMFVPVQNFFIKPEYIDEQDVYYPEELGETIYNCKTCMGAAGLGMLAGSTEDGGGFIEEGQPRDILDYSRTSILDIFEEPIPFVLDLLLNLTLPEDVLHEEMDCQLEKRLALPFQMLDTVAPDGKPFNLNVPIQIIKIGDFAILNLPLEVSTMSGRRLKAEVKEVLTDVTHVVINATSNAYGEYLATREEYAAQQYEGGSTLLGPYELNALRQWVHELAESFSSNITVPDYAVNFETFEAGLQGDNDSEKTICKNFDTVPIGTQFGDVKQQPEASYTTGSIATAVFWGGNPNNNLTVQSHETYLMIEKKNESADNWEPVTYDWDPSTRYIWERKCLSHSLITVEWHIPESTEPGEYRIKHIGQCKTRLDNETKRYEGVSQPFSVE